MLKKLKRIFAIFFISLLWLTCTKDERPTKGKGNQIFVTTSPVASITGYTALVSGSAKGEDILIERGFCWNLTSEPTISDSIITIASNATFTANITGLLPATNYALRAYIKTATDVIYGNEIKFKTLALPILSTSALSNITGTTATGGGNITSNAGLNILERGVCWNTVTNPTIANSKSLSGTTTLGAFVSNLSGLQVNTVYYVKAYATTSVGTAYGNELSFRTASCATLTTNAVSSITTNTAVTGGNITSDGGASVTSRGVCWNTSGSPTVANSKTIDGSGIGNFTSNLSGLSPGVTYYVRAYAVNSVDVCYGPQQIFTTTPITAACPVSTSAASSITTSSAVSGGNITSDGGAAVTSRGVCWNTIGSPTTANSKTIDGSGIGSFVSSLSGLNASTTYYVRSYAVNSVGTCYGPQQTFKTTALSLACPVSTSAVSSITTSSAVSGGNITSDGGAAITSRGVCWNTTGSPTTANFKTIDGSGVGSFVSSLTGLVASRTYYVRSYATNSVGTCYGPEQIFTTTALSLACPVSTAAASNITTTSAVSGGNITSDGGATIIYRGVCWNTSGTPTIANSKTIDGSGVGSFVSSLSGLIASTTYYIRSYATNSVGTCYGPQQVFTTTLSLVAPGLLAPSSGVNIGCCQVDFSWSAVANATSYEIQVSKSSTFTGTIFTTTLIDCGGSAVPQNTGVNSRTVAATSYCMKPGTTSENGTWYWRVRAINGAVSSAWSVTRSYNYTF